MQTQISPTTTVIAKVQEMAERDLTIDDFDCAKHVLFFKKCAKSLPAPWTWTVAVLAVGDVSVSLAFF